MTVVQEFSRDCAFAENLIFSTGTLANIFMFRAAGKMMFFPTPWSNDDERSTYLNCVRLIAVSYNVDSITSFSEAWQLSLTGKSELSEYEKSGLRPKDSDRRIEVAMVSMVAHDHKPSMSSREILRGADGAVVGLAPEPRHSEQGFVGGALTHLLPPARPTPKLSAIAMQLLALHGIQAKLVQIAS